MHDTRTGLRRLGVLLAVGWMGLTTVPALANPSAANDPYGDWVGQLVADKGRDCPTEGMSFMQIEPKRMIFVPETSNLILRGVPNKEKQHYHAQLVLKDARKQPLPMVFEAHPFDDTFEGVYGTPTCRAHIILRRPENHPMNNFLNRD